jgi:hypothetical protein
MKTEWNEQQMLSWQPRPASKRLERRIFDADHHPRAAKWFWGCLVPTTACALLTLMTLNHSAELPGRHPMFSLAGTGLTAMLATADDQHSAQNHLATVTFDSTNHSFFNSNGCFTPSTNFSNE